MHPTRPTRPTEPKRRCRLSTICGSNIAARSRGMSISTGLVFPEITALDRVPLRMLSAPDLTELCSMAQRCLRLRASSSSALRPAGSVRHPFTAGQYCLSADLTAPWRAPSVEVICGIAPGSLGINHKGNKVQTTTTDITDQTEYIVLNAILTKTTSADLFGLLCAGEYARRPQPSELDRWRNPCVNHPPGRQSMGVVRTVNVPAPSLHLDAGVRAEKSLPVLQGPGHH